MYTEVMFDMGEPLGIDFVGLEVTEIKPGSQVWRTESHASSHRERPQLIHHALSLRALSSSSVQPGDALISILSRRFRCGFCMCIFGGVGQAERFRVELGSVVLAVNRLDITTLEQLFQQAGYFRGRRGCGHITTTRLALGGPSPTSAVRLVVAPDLLSDRASTRARVRSPAAAPLSSPPSPARPHSRPLPPPSSGPPPLSAVSAARGLRPAASSRPSRGRPPPGRGIHSRCGSCGQARSRRRASEF